jgi:quinol monooxygenase YgiN
MQIEFEAPRVVLLVRFTPKPGKKEVFFERLTELVEKMRVEQAFIGAVIHDDIDDSNALLMYETWQGTRESWLSTELARPYRAEYESALTDLLETRTAQWLLPIQEWKRYETETDSTHTH